MPHAPRARAGAFLTYPAPSPSPHDVRTRAPTPSSAPAGRRPALDPLDAPDGPRARPVRRPRASPLPASPCLPFPGPLAPSHAHPAASPTRSARAARARVPRRPSTPPPRPPSTVPRAPPSRSRPGARRASTTGPVALPGARTGPRRARHHREPPAPRAADVCARGPQRPAPLPARAGRELRPRSSSVDPEARPKSARRGAKSSASGAAARRHARAARTHPWHESGPASPPRARRRARLGAVTA